MGLGPGVWTPKLLSYIYIRVHMELHGHMHYRTSISRYLSESNIVALSSSLPAGGQSPHQPLDSILHLRMKIVALLHSRKLKEVTRPVLASFPGCMAWE